jgi:hypothetical protein
LPEASGSTPVLVRTVATLEPSAWTAIGIRPTRATETATAGSKLETLIRKLLSTSAAFWQSFYATPTAASGALKSGQAPGGLETDLQGGIARLLSAVSMLGFRPLYS